MINGIKIKTERGYFIENLITDFHVQTKFNLPWEQYTSLTEKRLYDEYGKENPWSNENNKSFRSTGIFNNK